MLKEMRNFFAHFFLPHKSNNQRARLLHHEILFLFVLFLLCGAILLGNIKQSHPQVLGLAVDISAQDLLSLTNQKRQEVGAGALNIDAQLTQAAQAKAADMFAKNYWAHFSPTGKSPWDFIHGAGYQYIYAGENLARGFTTASDIINAWMASPDHRANMLSKNFTDVGFAFAQGNLTGDNGTVLVVEEFGSRTYVPPTAKQELPEVVQKAAAAVLPTATPTIVPPQQKSQPIATHSGQTLVQHPLINSAVFKNIGIFLLGLFIGLFFLDIILIEQKKVVRIVGHNLDHILFLGAMLIIAGMIGTGVIF